MLKNIFVFLLFVAQFVVVPLHIMNTELYGIVCLK